MTPRGSAQHRYPACSGGREVSTTAGRRPTRVRAAIWLAVPMVVAVPALTLRVTGASIAAPLAALLLAAAVIGAAFLLTWGTELAELDIGEGLALALLAAIAVLPEYAVDVVFAIKAGQDPGRFAPLALANMTGANRLLIGVGWSVVALVGIAAARRAHRAGRDAGGDVNLADRRGASAVQLRPVQVVEVAFLALASLYALTFAFRSHLTVIDTVVLVGMFGVYLWVVARAQQRPTQHDEEDEDEDEDEASELFGPAITIAKLRPGARRVITVVLLVAAAGIILLVAEPFADALVQSGQQLHVNEFLLVQWVAPLASETPEFIAVLLMAYRLHSASALGALVSSKINQWTLLVGVLPLVFAFSSGSLGGLPIDPAQREELALTAAQSLFAVALVVTNRLTSRGAIALLALFAAQFLLAWALPEPIRGIERITLTAVYLLAALVIAIRRRTDVIRMFSSGLRGRARPNSVEPDAS